MAVIVSPSHSQTNVSKWIYVTYPFFPNNAGTTSRLHPDTGRPLTQYGAELW